jgi:uncharacterized protein (TIGR02453 family)
MIVSAARYNHFLMATHFSPEALKFLRSLKRNNRREWFTPRKPQFESLLRTPMLSLIRELNSAMESFAPDHIRPPKKTIFRIYRDTRFASDKRPYKTHVAAWWAHSGMLKTSGAGFYFHIAPDEVIIACGVFMPQREQLLQLRRYLLTHHAELRRVLNKKSLRTLLPDLDSAPLSRPPKGFAADHPGIDLIRCTQWGLSITLPPEAALQPTLFREVLQRFRAAAPLVHLLNAALLNESVDSVASPSKSQKALSGAGKSLFPLPGF